MNITIKTIFGLEELLAEEVSQLGATDVQLLNRAVSCTGDLRTLYKINLWSRTALRVLVPIDKFRAHNEEVLYNRIRRYHWTDEFSLKETFAINSTVKSEIFTHSKYVSLKVKDAINDQFRDRNDGQRPYINVKDPDISIDVHCSGKDFIISLDSSGQSLHKRGYRQGKRLAPLNEVLASGMLMHAGWNEEIPLYDPMCGSGTILTEAYQIAKNIAPGLHRERFSFMNWDNYDADLWESLVKEAKDQQKATKAQLIGTDIDGIQINETKDLLDEIGYSDSITVRQGDFFKNDAPISEGMIICNPPYDERVKTDDIDGFYKQFGDALKQRYQGGEAWILCGNKQAIKKVGLRTSKKLTLFNGPIECKYHKYEMYQGTRKTKDPLEATPEGK